MQWLIKYNIIIGRFHYKWLRDLESSGGKFYFVSLIIQADILVVLVHFPRLIE